MPPTTRKTTPTAPAVVEDKYAPTAWVSSGNGLQDLTVPSGQTCLVRRPGVEGLLTENVLFETDFLSTIIQDNITLAEKGVAPKEVDLRELTKDPKKMAELVFTVDKIVCAVVVKPVVKRVPDNPLNRQNGVVYTDMIDLTDKLFIVDFALGGSGALETFPEKSTASVGGVQRRQGTRRPAKSTAALHGPMRSPAAETFPPILAKSWPEGRSLSV